MLTPTLSVLDKYFIHIQHETNLEDKNLKEKNPSLGFPKLCADTFV